MEYILIGIALAFNLLVIKVKYEKGRIEDATLDLSLLALISFFFSGSYGALAVGTVASAVISVFLWFYPPNLSSYGK